MIGLRLPWLFKTGRLSSDLDNLSHCIREDGNDAAYQGTLLKEEALEPIQEVGIRSKELAWSSGGA